MSPWLSHFRREKLLTALLLAAVLLGLTGNLSPSQAFSFVEWGTIGILLGLLCLSCGLEESGYFQWFGIQFLRKIRNERTAALIAVLGAAALSAVVTNDISLFIVVPITIGMAASFPDFPLGRLIIFEALAVNAGSAITPIGNPQNLFLWQTSGVSFLQFITVMLPLGAALVGLLMIGVWLGFSKKQLQTVAGSRTSQVDRALLVVAAPLYPLFLAALELGFVVPAIIAVTMIFLILKRSVFRHVDWALLLLFGLMFIDLRAIAVFAPVRAFASYLLALPHGGYPAGVVFSQIISNVLAAILLQSVKPVGHPLAWKVLAWGVDVGGFGLAVGSL